MDIGDRLRFSREQWYVMVALCGVKFAICLSISFQWPLFPREAEKKGTSATQYGLVLATYNLGSFISCPIFGNYINRIGAKKMLNFGLIFVGISVAAFGLLDLIESHVPFITMAFVIKLLECLGAAAVYTSSYSITIATFFDSIATSFAITEAFSGFGFMLGPILGGYLFEVGGYILPFAVVSVLLLAQAGVVLFLLPDIDGHSNLGLTHVRLSSVLMLVPVCLDLFARTCGSLVVGFTTALLEPHLRQFHLNPVTMGSMFMIATGIYTFLSPVVGYLCDKHLYSKIVIIVGGVLLFTGTSLIGPAPFIPMDTKLWVVCIGLMFNGVAQACIQVPTFIDAIHSAVALGLPNDMALYGVVSGLSHSAFSLGEVLGTSIAGILLDSAGFRYGSVLLLVILAVLVIAMTSYVCTERRAKRLLFVEPPLNYKSIPTPPVDERRAKHRFYHSV